MLPIGLKTKHASASSVVKHDKKRKPSLSDIERQIAELEDGTIDATNEESKSEARVENDNLIKIISDNDGNLFKLCSLLEEHEKIEPLPKKYLPAFQCSSSTTKGSMSKRNLSNQDRNRKMVKFSDETTPEINDTKGLEKTIREMLRFNYEPASLEKRPLYCRVCKYQGSTLEDLELHRLTDYHKLAVNVEKKLCFCKLCRKQFTSLDQLREHLKGKLHMKNVEIIVLKKNP